ncbi:MAG TPA: methyltransferase domain-containing protein, partial [Gaiellaceae bacterium]|nr:methyltransferase domain-containing protein [Gaiellaceae bacterium]
MDREQVFDEDYLYFYETFLTDELSDRQAELIWRLLELEPGMEVLDLACGHGRIANRLAERGARVTGLDATPFFLELARADAARREVEVEYVEGDMRRLPWTERFDRTVNWFTAFGYFDDDENRLVLREAHRALKPGGCLAIENNNLAGLLGRWQPAQVVEREGNFAIDRSSFDPTTGRATTDRVIVRDGRTRRFEFSVRMFVAA